MNLKFLGHDAFISFEDISINYFYDCVVYKFPSFNVNYILHIESKNHEGISLSQWIVFYVKEDNIFDAMIDLHSYIVNTMDEHNFNNLCSKIVNKNGLISPNQMFLVKDIDITYYEYVEESASFLTKKK